MSTPPKTSSGCRGCLIWMSCIFVGFALIVGVAGYFGYRKARHFLDQYAATKPLVLPEVKYGKPELQAVHERIDHFELLARAGRTNAQLALSAADMNALILETGFTNRLYVTLESNRVNGKFSIPFEELGMPLFHGRYLNGSGALAVSATNGELSVSLTEIQVNGQTLPEHYMKYIRGENLAQNVATNAQAQDALEHISRIAVENGQLIFESERGKDDSL